MDKNAIRAYAIWARSELLKRVKLKAAIYGIEKDKEIDYDLTSFGGSLFSDEDIRKRKALIEKIDDCGFDKTMEEIAYTWFNRFISLRFMGVNGYLPSKVRMFTDKNNRFNPQVITEILNIHMPGLEISKVVEYERSSNRDGLFRYIIITQCNALNKTMPEIFEKIDDYTDLLLPDNLLRDGSVIQKMVEMIPEEDWKDQVQIIGWLYQYYNTELKDEAFARIRKNEKITKDMIPPVTQLFTPDWIVKYMVENSLGKFWMERREYCEYEPRDCEEYTQEQSQCKVNNNLSRNWKYYMGSGKQNAQVEEKLKKIKKERAGFTPEDIKCIDPCAGSGHILCYLFDLLMEIYESYGYRKRDAVRVIIEKNIYGLDIDERAKQLAYFSVMMKARGYDRRFFERDYIPQPHVYVVDESNYFKEDGKPVLEFFIDGDKRLRESMDSLIFHLHDAKEYGSIIEVKDVDFDLIYSRFDELEKENMRCHNNEIFEVFEKLLPLVKLGEVLAQRYSVVVTNPPYMGGAGMNEKLAEYIKKNYPDSKQDLFAVFIERCKNMTAENGFTAMITQHSWMFLSSYEKLREKIGSVVIENMAHLGSKAFEEIGGEVVQTTSFILRNSEIGGYRGRYARLVEGNSQDQKEELYLDGISTGANIYEISQDEFEKIPGKPVAYWASKNLLKAFETGKKMDVALDVRQGIATGNNGEFLRLWYEVAPDRCKWDSKSAKDLFESGKRWIPYNKGGKYRKWYGNYDYLIKFDEKNYEKLNRQGNNLPAKAYYFREAITWGLINSGGFSIRYRTPGGVHDVSGMSAFYNGNIELMYILGLMSTPVAEYVFNMLNPTINLQAGDFKNFPVLIDEGIRDEVIALAKECVELAKEDWDMHETSWDFKSSPLLNRNSGNIEEAYKKYRDEVNLRFERLKENEERLNKIFIELYGVKNEIDEEVADRDISVAKIFDKKSEIGEKIKGNRYVMTCEDVIKKFISYGVGVIFGRYVPGIDGVVDNKKTSEGIVPVTEEEYFEDGIVTRFAKVVSDIFGEENLEENLRFIAGQLKGDGTPREKLRSYFVNDFYKDHCKAYNKRPIYWQFDSGKNNGLKVLIYIHSYRRDVVAKIRMRYLHEIQGKYTRELGKIKEMYRNSKGHERIRVGKKVDEIKKKLAEVKKFQEEVHHIADMMIELDLDNGVKENYKLFGGIVGKIK